LLGVGDDAVFVEVGGAVVVAELVADELLVVVEVEPHEVRTIALPANIAAHNKITFLTSPSYSFGHHHR
jgi:hypothetical protein